MAEDEFNPVEEGRRIAREYLSRRGWASGFRRTTFRQLYSAGQREELEAKQRQIDHLEEEAEETFSRDVERWRRKGTPQAKEVLITIVQMLGKRLDLGFFAKRIVERLKRDWGPL